MMTTIRVATFLFSLWGLASSALANQDSVGEAAKFELTSQAEIKTDALQLDTKITGEVNGLVASLTMVQQFRNDSDDWVNGNYLFPLPEGAAVDSLILETDGRVIVGVVKEKEQAKKEFEIAKASGTKAGLLEQRRPNLFAMALANIAPGGDITATITWVETVRYQSGQFALRLPTTITPRYIPGKPVAKMHGVTMDQADQSGSGPLQVDQSSGWAINTDQVADASAITPFQQIDGEQLQSQFFEIDVEINAGIPLASIVSTTHVIDIRRQKSDSSARIVLRNGREKMHRDLVLNWTPRPDSQPTAAVFNQQQDGDFHSLIMLMPPAQNIVQTLLREVTFIIDSSGSMAGVSMPQAKQGLKTALGYLSPQDRFNVIDFDSGAVGLFMSPQAVTPQSLGEAAVFVDGLIADGGTNMEAALSLAFNQPKAEGYLRQIIFITDGSVGNEAVLFNLIHRSLGDARLFTVGIGSAPNSYFMRGAADFGRGIYINIDSLNEAAIRMQGLFAKINRPVMRDISLQWPDFESSAKPEFYPAKVPDLYIGEPMMISVKSTKPLGTVTVKGALADEPWLQILSTDEAALAKNLNKVWARRKVAHLENEQVIKGESFEVIKPQLVKLGIAHQLITRFTSFVAIDQTPVKPQSAQAEDKAIANLMPNGNTMTVPSPHTATSADLLLILGSIGLLILLLLGWLRGLQAMLWRYSYAGAA